MWARRSGFTIVELLIVVVIIAIIAAITVVTYTGIQDRAQSSALQTDLTNAKKKLMVYGIDNTAYPSSNTLLSTVGISATKSIYDTTGNNFYYCYNTTNNRFALGARTAGKTSYIITSEGNVQYINGVGGDQVCQAIGLTGYADANGFISNGYQTTGGWQTWVKG